MAKNNRPTFTDDQLERASDALHYEVSMLYEMAARLVRPPEDWALRNALVESFLVHVRTLIEFFESVPKYDDDLVAADFCKNGWTKPSWSINKADIVDRINKRLSHLTHKRLEYVGDDRKWRLKELVDAFDGPLVELAKCADRGHPGPDWKKYPLTNPFSGPIGPGRADWSTYRGDTGPSGPTGTDGSPGGSQGPSGGTGPIGP